MGTDPLNPDSDGDGINDKEDPNPNIPTSVDQVKLDQQVKVYPTVVSSQIHIEFDRNDYNLSIVNSSGVVVYQKESPIGILCLFCAMLTLVSLQKPASCVN